MLKSRLISFLIFVMSIGITPIANAQILPGDSVTLTETISVETANAFLDNCLSDFPHGFTPKAHKNFCNCSAANVRLNLTNSDLVALNLPNAQRAGNPVFEKYVHNVVGPCMAVAVDDIGYYSCIESRAQSPYIKNILPYCKCVGAQMSRFAEEIGAETILTNMKRTPTFYDDPIQTLLGASIYTNTLNRSHDICRPIGQQQIAR